MIEKSLSRLGIVGNLYRVYRAALELGDVPAARIIERTGLPKATVYDALARLEQDGLVANWGEKGKRRIVAYDPEVLIEQLDTRRRLLDETLPQLRSIYNAARGKPGVRFYEGADGIEKALWDYLSTGSKEVFCTFSMVEIMEALGPDRASQMAAARQQNGVWLRVIRSRQRDIRDDVWSCSRAAMREVRFAPENFLLSMTMLIYENRVAVVSSQKEAYGLVVESLEFSNLIRTLFMSMWEISERVPFIEDVE